jgi:hypothetical protein
MYTGYFLGADDARKRTLNEIQAETVINFHTQTNYLAQIKYL